MKINENNYISEVITHLEILKQAYEDGVIPSILDGSDHQSYKIEQLIEYLNKTN